MPRHTSALALALVLGSLVAASGALYWGADWYFSPPVSPAVRRIDGQLDQVVKDGARAEREGRADDARRLKRQMFELMARRRRLEASR